MDSLSSERVAIIGAGPAGVTTAYQLAKAGIGVDVFEAGESIGGLAKTISLWNQKVDLGPHRFFSNDSRINKLWLEVIGADYEMVNRLTRIFYKEKFVHYPLRPFGAFFKLGLVEVLRSSLSNGRRANPLSRRHSQADGSKPQRCIRESLATLWPSCCRETLS